jgi:hypothetical protein
MHNCVVPFGIVCQAEHWHREVRPRNHICDLRQTQTRALATEPRDTEIRSEAGRHWYHKTVLTSSGHPPLRTAFNTQSFGLTVPVAAYLVGRAMPHLTSTTTQTRECAAKHPASTTLLLHDQPHCRRVLRRSRSTGDRDCVGRRAGASAAAARRLKDQSAE